MMRIRELIAAILLLVPPAAGRAQTALDREYETIALQGIEHVYNLEFERADEEFRTLIRMNSDHPAGPFFLAMIQWWRIMIDIDDEQYDRQFLAALDSVVDMCDALLDKNPNDVTAIFFKGGAIGFQGRLRFHRSDYLAAANAGRKALPLVRDASSLDPTNVDILLGTGIYNYYADVIPREYPFVKPLILFIPPGDRQKGIEQLTLASEKGTYASVEASYFLLQIYYFYEKDYAKALDLAQRLNARFPNNMLFHRYVGRCYVAVGRWGPAQAVFAEIASRVRRLMRGYGSGVEREAEYYLGMAEMLRRRDDAALEHFYRCDELSRNVDRSEASGFMAMANLKIGMIYDLQAKRDLAIVQYRKVLDMKDYKDAHAQAEQFLTSPCTQ
jgi:tetratricopeptide (TPR) repeat protein